MSTVTRYVLTHLDKSGMRTLASAAQGRWTYETREEAEAMLAGLLAGNGADRIAELYGQPLEVRPCTCWAGHFDPVGIYFDN